MQLYTIAQMQALEAAADAVGYTYARMMEEAGQAVADAIVIKLRTRGTESSPILVLVGPGNNGGDGLVAARALALKGCSVVAYLWKRPEDDPLVQVARHYNVSVIRAEHDMQGQMLRRALSRVHVIVDALFGTGLSRAVKGKPSEILDAIRTERESQRSSRTRLHWVGTPQEPLPRSVHSPLLVAVDIPSGLNGDSGQADEHTVPADLTVTFAGPKVGMVHDEAVGYLGELMVADIGIPPSILAEAEHMAEFLTPRKAAELLPKRAASGHKGTFGTTLVVGGSLNYTGAPALSALAAGRSGAGLVTLGVPEAIYPILAARPDLTSVTWVLLPDDSGVLRADAVDGLRDRMQKVDALIVGPGLGTEATTRDLVYSLLRVQGRGQQDNSRNPRLPPTLVDADGLNALAQYEGAWWDGLEVDLVLTPHPGEMARLLNKNTREVQANRLEVVQEAARRFGQVVVLKGAFTMIATPDGRVSVAPFANDALAKAGSGDILSGIIGALLGQGTDPYSAACLGVMVHGVAGEFMRQRYGSFGSLSSDLLELLPQAWEALVELR